VSVCLSCLFFFFSSRRRHTRSDRDWSSDVCSSDLPRQDRQRQFLISQGLALAILAWLQTLPEFAVEAVIAWQAGKDPTKTHLARSEERRVGKEGRCRWTRAPWRMTARGCVSGQHER